jgi:cell wall-associated NlpC family hydrolase
MDKGICTLSSIPVREKPSDRSQMINQLLFGDLVQIKDRYLSWLFIETLHDDYAGWIDEKQITLYPDSFFGKLADEQPVFLTEKFAQVQSRDGNTLYLTAGNRLPLFNDKSFHLHDTEYAFSKTVSVLSGKQSAEKLLEIARQYLGTPYLWGGRSFFGNDCSGFTQIIFRICGYKLLRDASQQAEQGTLVSFVEEAQPADLAFFENEEGRIVHVGILLNNHEIIHSSGQVRIDAIDHEGIYNQTLKKYTHKLRFIKRILP